MLQDVYELLKIAAVTVGLMSPVTAWVWKISSRVQRLETQSMHSPTNTDFHDLTLSIQKLSGEIQVLSQQVVHTNQRLDKSDQYTKEALQRLEKSLDIQRSYLNKQ